MSLEWDFETAPGKSRRKAVAVTNEDGDVLRIGDIVAIDSFHGIIASFQHSVGSVRVLKLVEPANLCDDSSPAELLLTTSLTKVNANKLGEKIHVYSKDGFTPTSEHDYFCYRAVDSKGRLSDTFDWTQLIQETNGSAELIAEKMADLFRSKFETPRKPARKKLNVDMQPITLFEGETESDEEPSPRKRRSRRTARVSMAISEDEFSDDIMDDASDSSDEEVHEEAIKEEYESPKAVIEPETIPEPKLESLEPKQESDEEPRTPRKKRKQPVVRTPRSALKSKSLPTTPRKETRFTAHSSARDQLHISAIPETLPCRENEFSQVFLALESAIQAGTGTTVYVSGTPGVGKTATVREVVAQLQLRHEDGELPPFVFLEVNGMKLTHPNVAYDLLWKEISENQGLSSANAMAALEAEFQRKNPKRPVVVVLMDELDQLVTKNLGVMYNFFNWPALPNSKLVVVAVANTMDLPERLLSNKISSRLGLTRIQFRGYTYADLRKIISTRLEGIDIVEADAVEYVARKVAGVSGDARRALDLCRRAVELGDGKRISIDHVRQAINESQATPLSVFLPSLSAATKVLLCAVLARIRRSKANEVSLRDVLHQVEQLVQLGSAAELLEQWLYDGQIRMQGFRYAVNELVEAGVLVQQVIKGEATPNIRLNISAQAVKDALEHDADVGGMI